MTQQMQKEARMDKREDDWNGFSMFIFFICNDWYNAWKTYFVWQRVVILFQFLKDA